MIITTIKLFIIVIVNINDVMLTFYYSKSSGNKYSLKKIFRAFQLVQL